MDGGREEERLMKLGTTRRVASRPLVLLDTNALLLPFTRRFPLENEIYRTIEGADIRVPSSVLKELERLSMRGTFAARAALAYAKRFLVVPTDLDGDAAMETLAQEMGATVVTMDRALRHHLEEIGLSVLYPGGGRLRGLRPI